MIIEANDFKINVLILLMESEVDATIQTVETLIEGISDGVIISVLLNGGSSDKLANLFSNIEFVRYYESNNNLGVAGGRNYLLQTNECKRSDIVLILDNDVIPPVDYIKSLSTFLVRNRDAGVVGAVVANVKNGVNLDMVKKYGKKGIFGNKIFNIYNRDIKESLIQDLQFHRLFHIGVHPDFFYSYFSLRSRIYPILNSLLNKFKLTLNVEPFLINNSCYLEMIENGSEKYAVSNVVGCSQAFRRKLVDEIGYLSDLFNPYGFEDVDFNIRALKAGYKNYIDTNTWLLHGTDSRHEKRNEYTMLTNHYRCRTLLAYRVLSGSFKLTIIKLIIGDLFIDLLAIKWDSFKRFKSKLDGFKKGLEIIKSNTIHNLNSG